MTRVSLFTVLLTCLMLSAALPAWGQKQVKTTVEQVTLFIDGAQVTRTKTLSLPAGESTLVFTGMSPYMDAKSVQVNARGNFTVMGVNHHFNYLDSLVQSARQRELEAQLADIERQQRELKMQREVTNAEIELLKTNCSVSNRTVATTLAAIKELSTYYAEQLTTYNKRLVQIDEQDKRLSKDAARLRQELASCMNRKPEPVSEVEVKVDVPRACEGIFHLTYYVKNAGWFPSYDIRSVGLTQPLILSYKANIRQDTKEEWKNVSVLLSSSNPTMGNVAPRLETYWLDYGLPAPRYGKGMIGSTVSGKVMDEDSQPLVGVSVMVEGSTIGTVTDTNGDYSITLPEGKRTLQFAYIGYSTVTKQVNSNTLNVWMEEDAQMLEEVVVKGYGATSNTLKSKLASDVVVEYEMIPTASAVMDVEQEQGLFGYEFEIKKLLTIPSDKKPVVTEIGRYELPVSYAYTAIPKVDKDAFLMAETTEWRALNLLEGEANVYFENGYVGKSTLNPTQASDTLRFSMGRDNGIRIQRTKVNESMSRKTLASSQVQAVTWRITVHNTRQEAVNLTLQDQVPVSRNNDITVSVEQLSGGRLAQDTGIVTWTLPLQPGEKCELLLSYKVKSPKGRRLVIE